MRTSRIRWAVYGVVLSVVVSFALSLAPITQADADVGGSTQYFYLAIGGSESRGFQPTPDSPHGALTDEGYDNDLVTYEAARGIWLDLVHTGCPGETTTTMLNGDDHCYRGVGTQLAAAISFLSRHVDEQGIVTIDLGFNNIRECLREETDDETCAKLELDTVRTELTLIVQSLKSVAGPEVTFVGLGHYDPYLADELKGGTDADFAHKSEQLVGRLNGMLRRVYSSEGVPMADVDEFFEGHDRTPIVLAGQGTVPTNVAQICQLTWMCASAPYGPDFHPDDEGYATIAAAIESVLSSPWRTQ